MICLSIYSNQWISAIVGGLSVLCVGCTVGWTTPILKKLKNGNAPIHLTNSELSWLAAFHEVGHFLSPIPAGYLISKVGRKYCLLGSSFIIVIGWVIALFSTSAAALYVSRLFFGIAMGIVFTTYPLYIAEISSRKIRGALSTCFQAMLYLGHLIEFSIGPYVSFTILTLISLIIACATFLLLICIVDSPLYLVLGNQRDRAVSAVQYLQKADPGEAEREICKLEAMGQVGQMQQGSVRHLFSRHYRGRLFIVVFAAVSQRFTGMSAVVAYAATNFPSTANKNGLNSDEYTIFFGALVFLFTFVSASLIDNLGRRPLILFSCFGCAISHFITATYFYERYENVSVLPFVTISLFSIIYSLGLGPLVNTLQGELFPPNIKGLASSIVTISHAASSFAVTKLFQVIRDTEGIYFNFYIFAASSTVSFILAYFIVPETKREELETLQRPDE